MFPMLTLSKQQKGVTLLEVLLGVALSALLVSGLYQFLASQRVHGQWLNTVSSMQQQGYAVAAILRHAIEIAGFSGCVAWQQRYSEATSAIEILPRSSLQNTELQPQSDILSLQYWQNLPATQVTHVKPYRLTAKSHYPFEANSQLILHDCKQMQAFRVEKIKHYPGKVSLIPQLPFRSDWQQPQLAEWVQERWMIATTHRKNATGKTISSLYQQVNQQHWQEVASDVYALQITKNNPLEVNFLIGSEQEIVQHKKKFKLGEQQFLPSDFRFYQAWQQHIVRHN